MSEIEKEKEPSYLRTAKLKVGINKTVYLTFGSGPDVLKNFGYGNDSDQFRTLQFFLNDELKQGVFKISLKYNTQSNSKDRKYPSNTLLIPEEYFYDLFGKAFLESVSASVEEVLEEEKNTYFKAERVNLVGEYFSEGEKGKRRRLVFCVKTNNYHRWSSDKQGASTRTMDVRSQLAVFDTDEQEGDLAGKPPTRMVTLTNEDFNEIFHNERLRRWAARVVYEPDEVDEELLDLDLTEGGGGKRKSVKVNYARRLEEKLAEIEEEGKKARRDPGQGSARP